MSGTGVPPSAADKDTLDFRLRPPPPEVPLGLALLRGLSTDEEPSPSSLFFDAGEEGCDVSVVVVAVLGGGRGPDNFNVIFNDGEADILVL